MSSDLRENRATGLRIDDHALEQVLALLGPTRRRGAPAGQRWAVLPHRRAPRYLVPVSPRKVSGAARIRTPRNRLAQKADPVIGALVRSGAARLYPVRASVGVGDDQTSLVDHLRSRLGRADLQVAAALGRPRPNRKPVLQVIDGDGTTVAFGKLSVDHHTDELVRREGRFLVEHGGERPPLHLPEALLADEWRGRQLLLVKDLGAGIDGTGVLELDAATIRAIAQLGPTEEAPPTGGRWWATVEERISALPGSISPLLERCRDRAHDMLERFEGRAWSFGTWHGDLARWNAVRRGRSLLVWDWERVAGPVPVGFDAVHAHFQPAVVMPGTTGPQAASTALAGLQSLLSTLGYDEDRGGLVVAYLLELRLRLAEDEAMGSLGDARGYADAVTAAALEWEAP
jgi:hypothetical protein